MPDPEKVMGCKVCCLAGVPCLICCVALPANVSAAVRCNSSLLGACKRSVLAVKDNCPWPSNSIFLMAGSIFPADRGFCAGARSLWGTTLGSGLPFGCSLLPFSWARRAVSMRPYNRAHGQQRRIFLPQGITMHALGRFVLLQPSHGCCSRSSFSLTIRARTELQTFVRATEICSMMAESSRAPASILRRERMPVDAESSLDAGRGGGGWTRVTAPFSASTRRSSSRSRSSRQPPPPLPPPPLAFLTGLSLLLHARTHTRAGAVGGASQGTRAGAGQTGGRSGRVMVAGDQSAHAR